LIKFLQDIQAKRDEITKLVGGNIYRYVVDKISVQTDRHGHSSFEVNWACRIFQSLPI
jgi:hypothetical protein